MTSAIYRLVAVLTLAAMPTAVEAKGITFDCDTTADHFSDLSIPAGSTRFTVTGTVRSTRSAESARYVPLARVQIASAAEPGHDPDAHAGLAVVELRTPEMIAAGKPAVELPNFTAKGREDELLTSMAGTPGKTYSFSLAYDGSKVTVGLGGETRSYPLQTADPVVRMVCSTGEFLFTDVTITPSR